ncbi:hypothetical protein EDD86DRAFT_211189 [Gorgonomyces haynaldii]|nr:hypothetical protein EDD86DRAFT_211189 [Gorgonomyces haynaldii]
MTEVDRLKPTRKSSQELIPIRRNSVSVGNLAILKSFQKSVPALTEFSQVEEKKRDQKRPQLPVQQLRVVWKRDRVQTVPDGYTKDLPMTLWYRDNYAPVDLDTIRKLWLKANKSGAQKLHNNENMRETMAVVLWDCSSIVKSFLRERQQDVREIESRIKGPTTINDVPLILDIWTISLDLFMKYMVKHEEKTVNLLRDLEKVEEENLFFKDFVAKYSNYSPDNTTEIKVQQVFKIEEKKRDMVDKSVGTEQLVVLEQEVDIAIEDLNELPPLVGREAEIQTNARDQWTQTDEIQEPVPRIETPTLTRAPVVQKPSNIKFVDVMDKASGTDTPIAILKSTSIQADLPHPIEGQYQELLKDHEALKAEKSRQTDGHNYLVSNIKDKAAHEMKEVVTRFTEEKKDYLSQIAQLKKQVSQLEEANAHLKAEASKHQMKLVTVNAELEKITRDNESIVTIHNDLLLENDTLAKQVKKQEVEIKEIEVKAVQEKQQFVELKKQHEDVVIEKQVVVEKLEKIIEEKKQLEQVTIEQQKVQIELKSELHEVKTEARELQQEKIQLTQEKAIMIEKTEKLSEENQDYKRVIAELMRFPDLSFGLDIDLKQLGLDNPTAKKLYEMTEHNNLRISLLEQRNNLYRELTLKQTASLDRALDYSLYHPVNQTTHVFNKYSVGKPRPESATPDLNVETYIIGSVERTSHVNANSVRFVSQETAYFSKTNPASEVRRSRPSTATKSILKTGSRPTSASSVIKAGSRPTSASSSATLHQTRPNSAASQPKMHWNSTNGLEKHAHQIHLVGTKAISEHFDTHYPPSRDWHHQNIAELEHV